MNLPNLPSALLVTAMLGLEGCMCLAQQTVSINVKKLATDKLQLGWLVKSLVPAGGVQVFAQYQVEASSNLNQWMALTEAIVGTPFAGKELNVTVPFETNNLFLRVHVILDYTGIDLAGLRANGADFGQATLAGAEMFNCEIKSGRFDKADLRGASLQFAAFNNSSFREAILVGARMSDANLAGTDFSEADLS